MSHTPSFVSVPYDVEEVRDRQALNSVKGNYRYQRRLLISVGVLYTAASTFIVGLGFFLAPPKLLCRDGNSCNVTTACDEGGYLLDPSSIHSMVYEWKLVCDKQYMASLIACFYFVGLTTGSFLISKFTDTFGRQRTCVFCLFSLGISLLFGSFTPEPYYICIVSFVSGAVEAVLSVSAYLLLNEMISSDLRSLYSGLSFAFWSLGTMIVAILFYFFDNWRYVMMICAAIPLVAVPFSMCQHESVRWLVANKRDINTANIILKKMAVCNNIDPIHIGLSPIVAIQEVEVEVTSSYMSLASGFNGLCSSKKMRTRLFGINYIWSASNLVYYGILMCVSTYSGNVYINGVLLGFGEMIPNIIVGYCADYIKRRTAISLCCVFGCVTGMATWLLGTVLDSSSVWQLLGLMTLLLLTMGFVDSLFLLTYIFTAELFPTKVRGAGYAMCNTTCRIGGLLASNLVLIKQRTGVHPLLIISGGLLTSSLAVLTLPETLGQPLLDYH